MSLSTNDSIHYEEPLGIGPNISMYQNIVPKFQILCAGSNDSTTQYFDSQVRVICIHFLRRQRLPMSTTFVGCIMCKMWCKYIQISSIGVEKCTIGFQISLNGAGDLCIEILYKYFKSYAQVPTTVQLNISFLM